MSGTVVADGGRHGGAGAVLLRLPDFLLLGVALPIFVLADWPLAGWIAAAVTWTIQAVVIFKMEQKALAATEPRHQVGLVVGGSLLRAWIAAAAILVTYLIAGNTAGLGCALLLIALFSVYFANKLLVHFTDPADKASPQSS